VLRDGVPKLCKVLERQGVAGGDVGVAHFPGEDGGIVPVANESMSRWHSFLEQARRFGAGHVWQRPFALAAGLDDHDAVRVACLHQLVAVRGMARSPEPGAACPRRA